MHENKEKITKAQKEGKNSPLKKKYICTINKGKERRVTM